MTFSSANYWEQRYAKGGNSGAGSFGRLATFKAEVINKFCKEKGIERVTDFGCGDGNQLKLYIINEYVGLDVSESAIEACQKKYAGDQKKSFYIYKSELFKDNLNLFSAELTMSIDIIFHLVEDDIFEKYMHDLFNASRGYVVLYTSNFADSQQVKHVRHRNVTDWVEKKIIDFELIQEIENPYPLTDDPENESFAKFFIYERNQSIS